MTALVKFFIPRNRAETMLVASNSVTVLGVILLGWSAASILILFWLETLIIGSMSLIKIVWRLVATRSWRGLICLPFFIFFFGFAVLAHGMLVMSLFGGYKATGQYSDIIDAFRPIARHPGLIIGFLAFLASHTYSFVFYYIRSGERKRVDIADLMITPFGRVFKLHITILLGGILTLATRQPVWVVAMLTIFKIFGDLGAHRTSHRGADETGQGDYDINTAALKRPKKNRKRLKS